MSASRRARAAFSRSFAAAVALRCVTASTVAAAAGLRSEGFLWNRVTPPPLLPPNSDAKSCLLAPAGLKDREAGAARHESVGGRGHGLEADQVLAGRGEDLGVAVSAFEAELDA